MSVVEQTHQEYTVGHSEGNSQHNYRVGEGHADRRTIWREVNTENTLCTIVIFSSSLLSWDRLREHIYIVKKKIPKTFGCDVWKALGWTLSDEHVR